LQADLRNRNIPFPRQQAGRAFSRWRRISKELPRNCQYTTGHLRKKKAEKQIVVFSEVHSELDAARMTRIIIEATAERSTSVQMTARIADPNTNADERGADCSGVEAELGADNRE
jgi:hypothetical protein